MVASQVAEVTEAVKEAKDAKKEVAVELEKGADTVVGSFPCLTLLYGQVRSSAAGLPLSCRRG